MLGTILELTQEGRVLSLERGLLCISHNQKECGRVPVDTIEAVIVSAHQATFTRPFLVALAKHNIPLIVCDNQYKPVSVTASYAVHSEAGKRMRAQASAPLPLHKGLWKALIKEKIRNQANVLAYHDPQHKHVQKLKLLSTAVLSGDSSRKEGQAARLYWRAVLGKDFVRDPAFHDENILFNYVYTVLRTSVIRSLIGAGLHPALGVYHSHPLNAFALADDVMEPLRPLADHLVLCIIRQSSSNILLTPEIKKKLAGILTYEVHFENTPALLYQALHHMALSIARTYMGGKLCVKFPQVRLIPII